VFQITHQSSELQNGAAKTYPRSAAKISSRAARHAGNKPPKKPTNTPITMAHMATAGVIRKEKTTSLNVT
jgi:hypothetical protein